MAEYYIGNCQSRGDSFHFCKNILTLLYKQTKDAVTPTVVTYPYILCFLYNTALDKGKHAVFSEGQRITPINIIYDVEIASDICLLSDML